MNAVVNAPEPGAAATGSLSSYWVRDFTIVRSDAGSSTKPGTTMGNALSVIILAAVTWNSSPYSSADSARAVETNKPGVWLRGAAGRRSGLEREFPAITQATEGSDRDPPTHAEPLDLLVLEILALFPAAMLSIGSIEDPDEGWTKQALEVRSGVEDIDARMRIEDQFFERADGNPMLRAALQHFVVLFD